MNTAELRIGNYISACQEYDIDADQPLGYWYRVRSIGNEDQEFEQIEAETSESFEWIFKDNWYGIPITVEWLLKFGFERKGEALSFSKEQHTVIIWPTGTISYEYNDIELLDNIKYIHLLQNLYFALTSKQLILKE